MELAETYALYEYQLKSSVLLWEFLSRFIFPKSTFGASSNYRVEGIKAAHEGPDPNPMDVAESLCQQWDLVEFSYEPLSFLHVYG